MYEREKETLLAYSRKLLEYKLVSLSGGNIGWKVGENRFLVTPSAICYEDMCPNDIVLVDEMGNTIEGSRKPSSDLDALLYVFKTKLEVNAVIHTHQPYATSVGLVEDSLPACLVTLIDTNHQDVPVAPFTISSDEGMGKVFIERCGKGNSVILRNHGVLCVGKTLYDALENAVYLEESAKTYLMARGVGDVKLLTKEEIEMEDAPRGNYGQ
ncbi:MAG: class II aldolase/adducin family protein [Suipraeoptans sp.]